MKWQRTRLIFYSNQERNSHWIQKDSLITAVCIRSMFVQRTSDKHWAFTETNTDVSERTSAHDEAPAPEFISDVSEAHLLWHFRVPTVYLHGLNKQQDMQSTDR